MYWFFRRRRHMTVRTLSEYFMAWRPALEVYPELADGDPESPSCRWCRSEKLTSAGRTRHNGGYWCSKHDQPTGVS